jgi:mono/diheme cytochrome c family protein
MKLRKILTLRCWLLLASASAAQSTTAATSRDALPERAAAPTFTKDVAPILFRNCVTCHSADGMAAAVPLDSYEAVERKAKEVEDKVRRREMPPWPADPAQSLPFRNDPRLPQSEIDTLVGWVDAGAPKGNDADLPPKPVFTKGWRHPQGRAPDAVVALPLFTVGANGTVPYIQRMIKIPYADDKWISALQVRAGNNNLLHHMGITEVALPAGMTPALVGQMDAVASQIGAPGGRSRIENAVVADPANPGAYDMLGVYTPGTTFESYGEGNGKLLKGGNNMYINFNIHYTTTGRQETDQTQLALWFEPAPPLHMLYRVPAAVSSIIANGRELERDDPGTKAEGTEYALPPIPAGDAHYELIGMHAYREPITIYQLQPHAHVRARDFRYTVVYPDGHAASILSVPRYSYHFQLAYVLASPLKLPAGSKLIVTAHYDNSPQNQHLQHLGTNDAARRCGPENTAYFAQQNQSWDEMFTPLIQYSVDENHGKPLRLVTAAGCLAPGSKGGWKLIHGSRAADTDEQGTSSTEFAADSAMPLGSGEFQLLGTDAFKPTERVGTKVVVKGVLLATGFSRRINVTSMQSTPARCPR